MMHCESKSHSCSTKCYPFQVTAVVLIATAHVIVVTLAMDLFAQVKLCSMQVLCIEFSLSYIYIYIYIFFFFTVANR